MSAPSPAADPVPSSAEQSQAQWFAAEVQPHETMLRGFLRKNFPSLNEVDDLVQESYLRLMRAKLGGKLRSAKGFLFSAARNAAIDLIRHRQTVRLEPLTEKVASSVLMEGADAAELASLSQELKILSEAMRDLPDRCRQILILRRIHGLSHKEIAARLDISEHTVERQVGIGLRKCAEFLADRGVAVQAHVNDKQ